MSTAKVPDVDNPIEKDEIEPGVHAETYAIAPDSLDFSDNRKAGSGWIVDWNEDKSKVLFEYGVYSDNLWVPREKTRRGDPEHDREHEDRGANWSFF